MSPPLPEGELVELGRGADSVAYVLDGQWVVRFPLTENAQRTLRRELALLGDLAPALPLPIPAFAHVRRRDGQLEYAAYPVLRGEPLRAAAADEEILASLAAFLTALHAYPVAAAREAGVTEELISGGYHAAQRDLPRQLAGLLSAAEVARLDALFAEHERRHPPRTALLHSDLKPEHVLVDGGRVTGVLDWGDISLGDPDFDLAVIGIFFGSELLDRLLAHLPDRDPELVRDKARFFTTLRWLQDIRYDVDHGDAGATREGVERLREHLRAAG